MKLFDVYPLNDIAIVKGNGSYVWDENGTRYLDMYGGHAVISIGHTHPHYVARLKNQLDNIGFYSNSVRIPLQHHLAKLLGRVSGKENYRLFLCNSGAEANENAMKLASFHTGRQKIVAFTKAFHGRTSLAVAATDTPSIVAPVNKTGNIILLPFNDKNALEDCFHKYGSEIAGVIVEGIQGVGGVNMAEDCFLVAIRELCNRYESIYIADEIQCGYGRTGKFFFHDHIPVAADIYTMAKGMGNGFPVAGVMIAPSIKAKHGMLGTTFGGNQLACTAAIAVLEIMESEQLMHHAEITGAYILESLKEIAQLQHVRGKGLMIGFEPPDHLTDLHKTLLNEHKIFTGEARPRTIRLLPALNISKQDAHSLLQAIRTTVSFSLAENNKVLQD